jgi:hypothetical protein
MRLASRLPGGFDRGVEDFAEVLCDEELLGLG